MRRVALLVLVGLAAAGAAYVTRPGLAAFDAVLKSEIEKRIATTDIGASDDAIGTIALIGCKLRPSDCIALIRQSLEVVEERHPFHVTFRVKAAKRDFVCTGAFARIWCDRPLVQD